MPERKKKTAGRFGLVLPEMEVGLISCLDSFCRGSEDSQAGDILGVHVKGNTRLCLRQPEKKSSTYNCNRLCAHMGGEKKLHLRNFMEPRKGSGGLAEPFTLHTTGLQLLFPLVHAR